nr:hypothetical protein [Nitritalea halalkaliphila]
MTHWAKGDTALSIAITAASTLISFVMTPLSFAFWAGLYAQQPLFYAASRCRSAKSLLRLR